MSGTGTAGSREQAEAGAAPRSSYHHGHLSDALIDAVLGLIEERGIEQATLREAAKRAGVSPGAPFRHFRNKTALMTAVAEQALDRFREEIALALAEVADRSPLTRFRAIGIAYLRWAARNPTHFEIISNRRLIDFHGSAKLSQQNVEIRSVLLDQLEEARRLGELRIDADLEHVLLLSRAVVYGLSRMAVDGHFADWQVREETPDSAKLLALDLLMKAIGWDGDDLAAAEGGRTLLR